MPILKAIRFKMSGITKTEMKPNPAFKIQTFAKSRIASIDVCELGRKKHQVVVMLEADVTQSREKLREYKKLSPQISFNAWLVKVIGSAVAKNSSIAAYLHGKNKTIAFEDVNVSFLIEKELNGEKVPIPVVLTKVNQLEMEQIQRQLTEAKQEVLGKNQTVLQKRTSLAEKLYFYLPAFIRRAIWKGLLRFPHLVFSKMGNVAITSLGMFGKINGWFIPISIHPLSFGIGSIIKKPLVVNDKIEIREIMNMTVLINHDVIDGANAARFLNLMVKDIETGKFLSPSEKEKS